MGNAITKTYGVTIKSINVVAAVPADKTLMVSLAQGAVAAAEAQKFETVAAGKAAAAKIEARGTAEAAVLKARGDAESERVRAEGHKASADLLSENKVQSSLPRLTVPGTRSIQRRPSSLVQTLKIWDHCLHPLWPRRSEWIMHDRVTAAHVFDDEGQGGVQGALVNLNEGGRGSGERQ